MHLAVRKRVSVETWAPVACLVVLMGITAAVLMHAGRGTIFNFDDWIFVMTREGWRPGDLLLPHNEHLSLVPVLIYKVLFETVGLDNYWVFRLVLTVMTLGCGGLLFMYARPRIGPWLAVAVTAPVMLMGPGYWDLLWPFQIGYLGSLLAGLGGLLAIDRGTRRGEILACFLLATALGSSSVGIPIVAAAAIEVLLRDDRRQRWFVFGIPVLLYGAWYLKYGKTHTQWSAVRNVPSWILDGSPHAAGAAVGFPPDWGRLLAAALAVAVIAELGRAAVAINPRLVALVAMPILFWAAAAVSRSGTPVTPYESRYLFPLGLFCVLIAVELAMRWPAPTRMAFILAAILAAGALNNSNALRDGGSSLRSLSDTLRIGLTAMEIAGPQVGPEAEPDPGQYIPASLYFQSTRHYGSTPAWTIPQMLRKGIAVRNSVDAAEARLLALQAAPPPAGTKATACHRVPESEKDTGGPVGAGVLIRAGTAPVEIRLIRFGSSLAKDAQTTVGPGKSGLLKVPRDNAPQPWRFATRSSADFEVCDAA